MFHPKDARTHASKISDNTARFLEMVSDGYIPCTNVRLFAKAIDRADYISHKHDKMLDSARAKDYQAMEEAYTAMCQEYQLFLSNIRKIQGL